MSSLAFYSKKLLSGSFALALSQGSTQAVGLLLLPILTRYLSPEDYGTLAIIVLISSVLNLLYNPGMISATTRLYYDTENEERKKQLFGSAFIFFIIFPSLISIIFLGVGDYVTSKVFNEFNFFPHGVFAIILAFLSQPKRIWEQILTVHYKVPKIAWINFITLLLGVGISLILVVVFKLGVTGRIIGIIFGPFLLFFVSLYTFKKYTGFKFSISVTKELLSFGSPLIIAIWSLAILSMTSKYLLENMIGLEAVGLYDIAYKISSISLVLFMGFRKMWSPVFYENMQKHNYYIIKRLINFMITGMGLLTGVIILFNKEILLFLNKPFRDAGDIIPIIAFGIYFMGLLTVSNSFLGWKKNFKLNSLISGVSATTNILLNLWLIPVLGLLGAAIATLISYFLYFILGVLVSRDFFGLVLESKTLIVVSLSLILLITFVYLFDNPGFDFAIFIAKLLLIFLMVFLISKLKIISKKEYYGFARNIKGRSS
jgi:O-antigen/teichoic acid export membrane protein